MFKSPDVSYPASVDNVLLRFGRRAILGRLRGSRDVTAGGAGVENFMRIISTMPDDLGIRLINLVIGTILNVKLLSGTPLLIMRCDISLCMRSQDPGAASTAGEARASRSAAQQVESFIISSLREDNFFKHSI